MRHTWEKEIVEVLTELGGEAHYSDIYQLVQERGLKNLTPSWKSAVRQCIERFSSDSEVYKEGNKDLFYSVRGIGAGYWGLRDTPVDIGKKNVTEDDLGFPEGKKTLRVHISRERNPRVVRDAKNKAMQEHGRLVCEVCGFDFAERYGIIGEAFIEAHHTIPVSRMAEGDRTRVEDIALVCANCHRMLHRRRPWLLKDELKDLIRHD